MKRYSEPSSAGIECRRDRGWSALPASVGTPLAALGVLILAVLLWSHPQPAAAAGGCPNEAIRDQQGSTFLSGCRAYEMVSPLAKGNFGVTRRDGGGYGGGASLYATTVLPSGDGITYVAGGAFAETESSTGVGLPYLAQRGAGGWSTAGLTPPRTPPTSLYFFLVSNLGISNDGRLSVAQTPAQLLPSAPECSGLVCSLQLYLRDNVTHRYQTISRAPLPGTEPLDFGKAAVFADATPDLSHVLFNEPAVLVPGAPEGVSNLYEWVNDGSEDGELRLVGRGLDNEPLSAGSAAGQGTTGQGAQSTAPDNTNDNRRTISEDGRRIIFSSGGQLYVRQDGSKTIAVSASQLAAPEAPQPAIFLTAEAAHGSSIFFISGEKLTADSAATATEPDLYRFDVVTETLTDISASPAGAGNVQGVLGASADASAVYFAASAELISGEGVAGEPNVYLWRADGTPNGSLTFVDTLAKADVGKNWQILGVPGQEPEEPRRSPLGQRVSSNGRYLALLTTNQLTSYDTAGHFQAYLYDAATGTTSCASCNPDADASTADATLATIIRSDVPRAVSEDGRVPFQTPEAMSPADTNGQQDVYLYEGGAPHLISTGKSPELSTYLGMDASGNNVFFATAQELVGGDTDQLTDLYDARVNGGFAETPPPLVCDDEACRGAVGPRSPQGPPASAEIHGADNRRPRRDCSALARHAATFARRATDLGQRAKRVGDKRRAGRLRKQAGRLDIHAKRLDKSTKLCRRTNRKAGK